MVERKRAAAKDNKMPPYLDVEKKVKDTVEEVKRVKIGFLKEFKDFLQEYKILILAIAFIMGVATTDLVHSFVNNIVMPIITPFIPGGAWEEATFTIGPIILRWGPFLSALLNFVIIALVIFMMAKYALREEKVSKK